MECVICRRACARTMEFIILSMRKTEIWYIHLIIKMISIKLKYMIAPFTVLNISRKIRSRNLLQK